MFSPTNKSKYLTKTDLFDSIKKGDWKTFIDSILNAEFDIKSSKICGYTILSCAVEYGDLEVVKYLLQKGADGKDTNRNGTKPLHIAAKYSHQDLVEFFINLGVLVDRRDSYNRTPLHYAAETFHKQVEKPHVWNIDDHMRLPSIICPASKIHMELVYFLLVNGADIDARDCKGNVPLLLAAKHSCVDVVKLLILWGANVECRDGNSWTVLHYASFAGWLDVVQSVVDRGIDVNKTSRGYTSLMFAIKNSHKEVVELLIKSGANERSYGILEMTLMHHASKKGWLNVVQSLVDRGSDVNAKTCSGDTPLIISIEHSHRAIFDLLVKSGACLDCCDKYKKTMLHYACKTGWLDVAESLVEKGYDINAEDSVGNTPLLFAVIYHHKNIFHMLLKAGAHHHACKPKTCTFLHYVCRAGWLDVVQSLLNAGSDINAKTLDGETPLFIAAKFSHIDIFECFIEAGADVNAKIPRVPFYNRVWDGSDSDTDSDDGPFYNRVWDGSGSDTDSDDGQDWTVLHHASYNGWLEVVMSLVKNGIDVNLATFSGDTPLHLAARDNNLDIVKHLLNAGASNIVNEDGETAFKQLIRYQHASAEAIRLFLENGVYIQHDDFNNLCRHAFFKEIILQDAKLCTQAIINKFNNLELEKVYGEPLAVEYLPDIEKMKVKSNSNVARSIEQSVKHEIETIGYCNITEVQPIVLTLLSVRSFITHNV